MLCSYFTVSTWVTFLMVICLCKVWVVPQYHMRIDTRALPSFFYFYFVRMREELGNDATPFLLPTMWYLNTQLSKVLFVCTCLSKGYPPSPSMLQALFRNKNASAAIGISWITYKSELMLNIFPLLFCTHKGTDPQQSQAHTAIYKLGTSYWWVANMSLTML